MSQARAKYESGKSKARVRRKNSTSQEKEQHESGKTKHESGKEKNESGKSTARVRTEAKHESDKETAGKNGTMKCPLAIL